MGTGVVCCHPIIRGAIRLTRSVGSKYCWQQDEKLSDFGFWVWGFESTSTSVSHRLLFDLKDQLIFFRPQTAAVVMCLRRT